MYLQPARSVRALCLVLALVLAACSAPPEPPRLDALEPATGVPGTEVRLTGRFYDDVVATFCGVALEAPVYEGGARVPGTPALLAPGAAYATLRGRVPAVPLGSVCEVLLVRRGAPVAGVAATFTVPAPNAAPVAADDAYATDEDVALTIPAPGVLADDVDPDGDPLTAVLVVAPTRGSVALAPDGGFVYTPDADAFGADAFTYRASDGTLASEGATVTIEVAPVDDAPVAQDLVLTTGRDTPANGAIVATDADGDALTFAVTTVPGFGAVVLNPVTGTFTYTPDTGYTGNDAFAVTVSDGASSDVANVAIEVVPDAEPPVATADAYDALGNVPLVVAAASGVLANDTDPNGDALTAVAGTIDTTAGGSVALAADGSFAYVAPAGFTGADAFAYTVEDAGGLSSSGSVALTVAGRYWFVDAAADAGGDGRQGTPFASLAPLNGAAGAGDVDAAGDVILVRAGTYAGGLGLEAGQQLIGQGIPTDLTATVNGASVLLLPAATAPTLTATAGDAVTLAAGNTLRGFVAGSAPGAAIVGSAVGTLTVSDVRIDNPAGRALDLSTSGTLAATFGTISATGGTGAGLRLEGLGGTFASGAVSIANPSGSGLVVQSAGGTFTFGATTVTKTTVGVGVDLSGSPTVTFASLAATTSAGTALRVAGGTATVTTGTLAASGGAALDAADATLAATFTSTSSSNGPARGVALTNVAGSVALGTGALSGAAGEAFFVSGGGATVTYGGAITNAAGRAVSVASRSSGSVTLSGAIVDTGTGVLVQDVTGGSVTFSGASLALTTGANPAVTLTNNTGGAIAFTGGGLALTTTSGAGFTATGGGTVSVTGAANTIATETGTALNVANTTIAAAGLTFRSVAAGTAVAGPTNALVLSGTGTAGGLTVTGDGTTAGSGGTLQRTTGSAVVLNATHATQLRLMRIVRPGLHGVLATNATGALVLDRGSIDYEGANVANAYAARLENASTNATLTLDGMLVQGKLDANPALSVAGRGTSVLTVAVQDSDPADAFASRFTGLLGSAIDMVAGDDAGSTAQVNANVSDTRFDLAATGGGNGVVLRAAQLGTIVPNVANNVFDTVGLATSAAGVIDLLASGSGRVGASGSPGVVDGNTIVRVRATAGAYAAAGLEGFVGVRVDLANDGAPQAHALRVTNNDLRDLAGSAALVEVHGAATLTLEVANNTFGTVGTPVGAADREGVRLRVADSGQLTASVTNQGIVAGSPTGVSNALRLIADGGTAALRATVVGNTIDHLNEGVDFLRFRMETFAGTGVSACLDLRSNQVDGPSRLFELVQRTGTTFARNVAANVGAVDESGTFGTVAACPAPTF